MIINTHIHTFKMEDIPRNYLPLGMVRWLAKKKRFKVIAKIMNNINPFSDNDALDRFVNFGAVGHMKSQEEIYLNAAKHYPQDTKFGIMAMDMAYMDAGYIPREYYRQLDELIELKLKYPNAMPFMMADPRREDISKLAEHYIVDHRFAGVKLYPPLGYFPYDDRLYDVYKILQDHNKPVMTHCSPAGPVRFKGSMSKLKDMLSSTAKAGINLAGSKADLCAQFTHPYNYDIVFKDFPELRVCCAHFGSDEHWTEHLDDPSNPGENWYCIIKKQIEKWPDNFYTDISYTLHNKEFWPVLTILLENPKYNKNILFGSDYYMSQVESKEKRFCIELRAYLGEAKFLMIANKNPRRYLGI